MHTDLHITTAMQSFHLESPIALVKGVQGITLQCRKGTHETVALAALCQQVSKSGIVTCHRFATDLPGRTGPQGQKTRKNIRLNRQLLTTHTQLQDRHLGGISRGALYRIRQVSLQESKQLLVVECQRSIGSPESILHNHAGTLIQSPS